MSLSRYDTWPETRVVSSTSQYSAHTPFPDGRPVLAGLVGVAGPPTERRVAGALHLQHHLDLAQVVQDAPQQREVWRQLAAGVQTFQDGGRLHRRLWKKPQQCDAGRQIIAWVCSPSN